MFCRYCGSKLIPSGGSCANCGHELPDLSFQRDRADTLDALLEMRMQLKEEPEIIDQTPLRQNNAAFVAATGPDDRDGFIAELEERLGEGNAQAAMLKEENRSLESLLEKTKQMKNILAVVAVACAVVALGTLGMSVLNNVGIGNDVSKDGGAASQTADANGNADVEGNAHAEPIDTNGYEGNDAADTINDLYGKGAILQCVKLENCDSVDAGKVIRVTSSSDPSGGELMKGDRYTMYISLGAQTDSAEGGGAQSATANGYNANAGGTPNQPYPDNGQNGQQFWGR